MIHTQHKKQKGFTLIELLIVLTILVVLGVVVVVLIDPAEILAQSRDTQRISDLASIKAATQLVLTAGVPSNAGTVCYSTNPPETTSDPAANTYTTLLTAVGASGYGTTATSSAYKVDGTGWIRIDYTTPSTGRALTSLPTDPTNSLTAGLYYRWGCNYNASKYQYEVDAAFESAKYKSGCTASGCDDKAANDGGNSSTSPGGTTANDRYEVGNNLNVLPATAATS